MRVPFQIALEIQRLHVGSLAKALGKVGKDLTQGVYDMVVSLGQGRGPARDVIKDFDAFFTKVSKGLENLFPMMSRLLL